jgi:hypothetical protein
MSARLIKKYTKIYNKIENLYNEELLSLPKACKKEGISLSTYYNICKVLNKGSPANKTIINQEGGNKKVSYNNIINDVQNKTTSTATSTNKIDDRLEELERKYKHQ